MTDLIADRWLLDRPNSYIGRSVPRPNAPRLRKGAAPSSTISRPAVGPGTRPSCALPTRMPDIGSIDAEAAKAAPGVIAVVNGRELAEIHDPWVGCCRI